MRRGVGGRPLDGGDTLATIAGVVREAEGAGDRGRDDRNALTTRRMTTPVIRNAKPTQNATTTAFASVSPPPSCTLGPADRTAPGRVPRGRRQDNGDGDSS